MVRRQGYACCAPQCVSRHSYSSWPRRRRHPKSPYLYCRVHSWLGWRQDAKVWQPCVDHASTKDGQAHAAAGNRRRPGKNLVVDLDRSRCGSSTDIAVKIVRSTITPPRLYAAAVHATLPRTNVHQLCRHHTPYSLCPTTINVPLISLILTAHHCQC